MRTKRTEWGGELDTRTTCDVRHFETYVFNVAKAWKLAQSERDLGLHVQIYGGGKKSLTRWYGPLAKMPAGLQCNFSFQVVRRGNGYTVTTRGPLKWSVCRTRPAGRHPSDIKFKA